MQAYVIKIHKVFAKKKISWDTYLTKYENIYINPAFIDFSAVGARK